MGYTTRYKLKIIEGDNKVISKLREENEDAAMVIDDKGNSEEPWKWDHEYDMKQFSIKYPNILFKLIGEGESNDDIWHDYYINGKMQHCKAKIIFDDFDKDKLK